MKCRVCGNSEANTSYEVHEMMFGTKESFRYFQCAQCLCLQIDKVPDTLADYYPDGYYAYQPKLQPSGLRQRLLRLRNRYAIFGRGVPLGRVLHARHPSSAHRSLHPLGVGLDSRMLDVGCGSGDFLLSLKDLGFDRLLGVDPFNRADIRYENGLEIRKANLRDVAGQWDVVMFHHSFEHIPDPKETLRMVANLLAPEGCCVIRIPTVSSLAWKKYGVNWVQLDAPRHLFLHSIQSMEVLADSVGMQVMDVVYDSTSFQFMGSERYGRGIPLQPRDAALAIEDRQLFSKKEKRGFARMARELNASGAGDQAIFYLRLISRRQTRGHRLDSMHNECSNDSRIFAVHLVEEGKDSCGP